MFSLAAISLNSPWYYYFLSLVFAFAVSLWLYYRNKKNTDAPKPALRVLFVLRFLSTAFIMLFLLNVFLKRVQNQTENPVILFAIDNSSSMVSASDSAYIKTTFAEQCLAFKKSIGDKFEVKTILFGNTAGLSNENPGFTDKETDIENLVKDIENNYSGQNVGALVIASDGIYNKGANPVYSAERLGYPIYTIACGDTTENKDAAVQKINHNQVAYLGNNFPVEVVLHAKKFKDKELSVSLLQNGVLKAEQKIKASSDNFSGLCSFTLNAASVGLVRYTVKITPLEGEKNIVNNSQSFVLEVIDNRDKILLLASAPHPDFSAIREALSGFGNYELECSLAEGFTKSLKPYSLVILHGFTNNQLNLLNECKTNAIPIWLVNPLSTDNLPGIKLNASLNKYNDSEPYVDASFGLFSTSDAFKKFVKDLPAVRTFFGNYIVTNAASSFINQRIGSIETENPILMFTDINGLKCGLFLGDGLWRWKMRDFAEHNNHLLFNELVGKTVQYLAVKSDKSFFRLNPPKIVSENENVEFGAEVYNKSYEAITSPEVSLVLSNAENKKFNYTFSKTADAYKLNAGRLAPGDYSYDASVNIDGQLYVKKGSITVKEIFSEKINTVANHGLLQQLSGRSNGKLYYPAQLDKLAEDVLANETIKPVTYSQNSVSPLIDLEWLVFIILALLSAEWFLRKRFLPI